MTATGGCICTRYYYSSTSTWRPVPTRSQRDRCASSLRLPPACGCADADATGAAHAARSRDSRRLPPTRTTAAGRGMRLVAKAVAPVSAASPRCSAHGTHGRRGSRVVALSSPSPRRCLCCCLLSRQGNSSGACPPPLNLKPLTNGDMFYGDRKASEMKRLHLTKY